MASLVSALEFSKVIIGIFVMLYAYYFLRRSQEYIERRPWEFLFVASMLLFLVELLSALQLFRGAEYSSEFFFNLANFLEFSFLGFFLFSFIYQHHLLLKRGVIMINQVPTTTLFDRLSAIIPARLKEKLNPHAIAERRSDAKIDAALDDIEQTFVKENTPRATVAPLQAAAASNVAIRTEPVAPIAGVERSFRESASAALPEELSRDADVPSSKPVSRVAIRVPQHPRSAKAVASSKRRPVHAMAPLPARLPAHPSAHPAKRVRSPLVVRPTPEKSRRITPFSRPDKPRNLPLPVTARVNSPVRDAKRALPPTRTRKGLAMKSPAPNSSVARTSAPASPIMPALAAHSAPAKASSPLLAPRLRNPPRPLPSSNEPSPVPSIDTVPQAIETASTPSPIAKPSIPLSSVSAPSLPERQAVPATPPPLSADGAAVAEQVRRIKAIVSTTEQHLHEQEGRIDAARAVAVRADLERLKQALDDPVRNVHSLRQAIDRFFGKAS